MPCKILAFCNQKSPMRGNEADDRVSISTWSVAALDLGPVETGTGFPPCSCSQPGATCCSEGLALRVSKYEV